MAYPVCELPDYDFNESFDINYLRCQYDATAIELINKAEESITEHRYGAIDEARDREATRILSEPPTRTRRVRPAPVIDPQQAARLQVLIQQLMYDMLAEQHRLNNTYHNVPPPPSHPPPPRSNRPVIKIALDVSRSTGGVASCGICLSDEIPIANMVQTSCNHDYCDGCMTQIIRTKPCCAFCRTNITKICVNSQDVYNKMLNK